MRAIDQPVHDRVADSRVAAAEVVMPFAQGQLTGHDGGLAAIALLDEFQQITAPRRRQGVDAKVIQDEQIHLGPRHELLAKASVAVRDGQFIEQQWHPHELDGQAMSAGLVAQGTGQPSFATAGRAGHDHVEAMVDPCALRERVPSVRQVLSPVRAGCDRFDASRVGDIKPQC